VCVRHRNNDTHPQKSRIAHTSSSQKAGLLIVGCTFGRSDTGTVWGTTHKVWAERHRNRLRHCKESIGLAAPTYLAETWNSLVLATYSWGNEKVRREYWNPPFCQQLGPSWDATVPLLWDLIFVLVSTRFYTVLRGKSNAIYGIEHPRLVMTVLEASPMANQFGNQGRCAQEALPKDSESTVSGMTPNTRGCSLCEPILYIGLRIYL
jgi:hypothetical protein